MGILDTATRILSPILTRRHEQPIEWSINGRRVDEALDGLSVDELWSSQPHLRTVTTFLARNVAQLGLHVFERVSDGDRRRDHGSPVALLLQNPGNDLTSYDLMFALVMDACLYDFALWGVAQSATAKSGWEITRVPPSWVVRRENETAFKVGAYIVQPPAGDQVKLYADQVWTLRGYHPRDPRKGSPAINGLKANLREAYASSQYRQQVWENGGRVSGIISRPKDAKWTDSARSRFREDWRAKYTGSGTQAGGTPILEDGMTFSKVDFSAADQQWLEGVKLSFATVAQAFHVQPSMVGLTDGVSWASVREFRKMLYGDTLGPLLAQIEARINTMLLPMLGMDPERYYVEFNINEKLQGNFEDQQSSLQTAVGAPWMTRNEARARMNMPAIGNGDDLVTPLNVLIGGQASPTDSAPPPKAVPDTEVPANRRLRAIARAEEVS